MLVQRAVSYKLTKACLDFLSELMDMSNAFACSDRQELLLSVDELFCSEDLLIVKDRVVNAVVHVSVAQDEVVFVPKHVGLNGHLVLLSSIA